MKGTTFWDPVLIRCYIGSCVSHFLLSSYEWLTICFIFRYFPTMLWPAWPPANLSPTDCTYNGVTLTQGETAPDPSDPCKTCSCVSGSVMCQSVSCPAAPCTHPVPTGVSTGVFTGVSAGCCHSCDGCEYRGRTYDNGDVITGVDRLVWTPSSLIQTLKNNQWTIAYYWAENGMIGPYLLIS